MCMEKQRKIKKENRCKMDTQNKLYVTQNI